MKRYRDDLPIDDANGDDDVEAVWDAEIARRIRGVDAGKVALIPWSESSAKYCCW